MSHFDGRDGTPNFPDHPPRQAPTSAEIDAVIAAAIANAPPAPPPLEVGMGMETATRSLTPLMTNILPSAIGSDGRVNLFVGNLPYRVRWQDLKDLFRKAGTVLRADVSLGPDNRSRGYGNVLMGSREDAARAIDRFNGFTWQTRTLEVRPDRLPAEYEPQPHIHHKPMYGGFMPPPMPHLGPPGGWLHRPPQQGFGYPHMGQHGGPSPMGFRPPMSHQMPPIGASVLAGSLTSGPSLPNQWTRDTMPFMGTPDTGPSSTGRGSPATGPDVLSNSPKLLDPAEALGRAPQGSRVTPSLLPKSVSPELETTVLRRPSTSSDTTPPVLVAPPIPLNGLANQAKDLGAPSTLYDRVVFVKNLSLTTQWQDLKDLFRPAGSVMRADVATGPDGQSRGFGTVLFASKDDAQRAVGMFNGHEVEGRILDVQTERQTLEEKQIQPIHPASFGAFEPSPPVWPQTTTSPLDSLTPPSVTSQSPSNVRVPWQLNTSLPDSTKPGSTAARPAAQQTPPNPKHKHPGPISLPPFPTPSEINPMSPLQTRNLPPMTPSMPGFVFNAHPQTPPAHPQFLSPGAGPFSPGLPVFRSTTGGKSPIINAAPGAPVRPQSGSAALGTPTTEIKFGTKQGAGPPGSGLAEEYFPKVDEELVSSAAGLTIAEESPSELAGDEQSKAAELLGAKGKVDESREKPNGKEATSWSKVARKGL